MIKLYFDEDIHEDVAMALRLRGYDVKTTNEAGNKGLPDIDQLKYASSEGRAFISCNIADFNRLHSEFIKKGLDHNGIILSKQLSVGIIVKALLKILSNVRPEKIRNNVIWLNDWVK
jgi:hypothetical protein